MTPQFCQLALTTKHPTICKAFYKQLLGFKDSGQQTIRGIAAGRIFDCKKVIATCEWICGDDPFFQIEIFHFEQPASNENAFNIYRPGFNTLFIEVPDIAQLLSHQLISSHITQVAQYTHNGVHYLLARDIDNNLINIFSGSSSQALKAPIFRGIGATVKDLKAEKKQLVDGFQLSNSTQGENAIAFDPLFKCFEKQSSDFSHNHKSEIVHCGQYQIQLTEFKPSSEEPPKKLTDQGILNIALGIRDNKDFSPHYAQLLQDGYQPVINPVGNEISNTVYLNSDSLCIEFIQIPEHIQSDWGFPDLNAKS